MGDRLVDVLNLIRAEGPVARSQIAERLGFSAAGVSTAVGRLLEENLVVQRNSGSRSHPGRRPELLEFNGAYGHVLGLDLGARRIRAAVANLSGTIVQRVEFPTLAYEGGRKVADRLASIAQELIASVPGRQVLATGLASPGVLLPTTGRPWLAPFIPELQEVPLRERLEKACTCPVVMENDVDMAVLGELAWGAGQGSENVVFVNIGIGLAAGIVLNGQLVRGANRAAGEIGFMLLHLDQVRPSFSETGVAESFLAGPGIVHRYRALTGLPDDDPMGAIESENVFAQAQAGDAAAQQVVEESRRYLSMMLANLVAAFNPERLIVGGGVGLALLDVPDVTAFLKAHVPFVPDVVPARLGGDASLRGALACAMEQAYRAIGRRLQGAPDGS